MQLKNKVAIITGTGQGLGKAIAIELAQEGVHVILIGRNMGTLTETQEEIVKTGGRADIFVADVSQPEQLGWINEVIENFGLDILINNAGWSPDSKTIENLTEEELEKCFKTNVFSMFYMLKGTLPYFRKQNEGFIINISSRAGKNGHPRFAAYSASKFAVEGLTQALAKELEGTHIKCYAVAPGALNTPMREKLFGDAALKDDPSTVAQLISKLLSGKITPKNGKSIDPSSYL